MHCSMDSTRLGSNVFHDVNLAAGRPAHGINICAEHPERRPEPLAAWNFDASFDAAVSPRPLAPGQQPCGCIIPTAEVFLASFDHELAAYDSRFFRPGCIVLGFFIAPTIPAD